MSADENGLTTTTGDMSLSRRIHAATVNSALTPKREGRVTETAEFAAFARRIVRAYGRRVSHGDVEALPELLALSSEIDAAIAKSVSGLRTAGYSWAEIAARLGTTRQAAQQRFGRVS